MTASRTLSASLGRWLVANHEAPCEAAQAVSNVLTGMRACLAVCLQRSVQFSAGRAVLEKCSVTVVWVRQAQRLTHLFNLAQHGKSTFQRACRDKMTTCDLGISTSGDSAANIGYFNDDRPRQEPQSHRHFVPHTWTTDTGTRSGCGKAHAQLPNQIQLLTETFLPLRPCSFTQTPLLMQS